MLYTLYTHSLRDISYQVSRPLFSFSCKVPLEEYSQFSGFHESGFRLSLVLILHDLLVHRYARSLTQRRPERWTVGSGRRK